MLELAPDIFPDLDFPVLSRCYSEEYSNIKDLKLKRRLSHHNIDTCFFESLEKIVIASKNSETVLVDPEDCLQVFNENWDLYPDISHLQEAFEEELIEINQRLMAEDDENFFAKMMIEELVKPIEEPEENPFLFEGYFDNEPENENNLANNRRNNRQNRPRNQRQRNPRPAQNKKENLNEPIEIFELFVDIEVLSQAEKLIRDLQEIPYYHLDTFDAFSILCKICLKKQCDYDHLPCCHGFCVDCLHLLFRSYLDSSKILAEDIICPDCCSLIPEEVLQKHTSYETYEKIVDLRYKLKFQLLVAANKAVACPVPDCPGYAHIIPGEKVTACNKCKCSLCCLCKSNVHPGITCEQSALNGKDAALEELILSQNWKKCPTCGVPVEKMDGCQFLYCDSLICKGRNNLCYLCGRFVVEAQHFSHYKSKGPYGDSCNTLDGIPEDVDSTTLAPIIPDEFREMLGLPPVEAQVNQEEGNAVVREEDAAPYWEGPEVHAIREIQPANIDANQEYPEIQVENERAVEEDIQIHEENHEFLGEDKIVMELEEPVVQQENPVDNPCFLF